METSDIDIDIAVDIDIDLGIDIDIYFDINVDKIKSPNRILNDEEEKLNILKNYFCENRLSKFNYLFGKITSLV